jgi:Putative auto-transporter adhesin, head GIN domain
VAARSSEASSLPSSSLSLTRVVAGTLVIGNAGTARDVHAVVTGSGLIRVTATATLNAAVPGSGAIIYAGDPHVTSSVTGSGTITRG